MSRYRLEVTDGLGGARYLEVADGRATMVAANEAPVSIERTAKPGRGSAYLKALLGARTLDAVVAAVRQHTHDRVVCARCVAWAPFAEPLRVEVRDELDNRYFVQVGNGAVAFLSEGERELPLSYLTSHPARLRATLADARDQDEVVGALRMLALRHMDVAGPEAVPSAPVPGM
jgi:hypothetical protein